VFGLYLYLDGCQEGMKLWIKTDLVIYLMSIANYILHFYFYTAKVIDGLKDQEKMN
jgi:hypothetical protein